MEERRRRMRAKMNGNHFLSPSLSLRLFLLPLLTPAAGILPLFSQQQLSSLMTARGSLSLPPRVLLLYCRNRWCSCCPCAVVTVIDYLSFLPLGRRFSGGLPLEEAHWPRVWGSAAAANDDNHDERLKRTQTFES